MEIKKRKLEGTYDITLNPHMDSRGFFMRTFDAHFLKDNEIILDFVQENHSKSEMMGIIRGLHLQLPPFSETKLVRCIRGKILDVFVDLRINSNTFGQWDSVELTDENRKMVLIPKGFAHGFCTLTEISEVLYKVDNCYSKENELGLLWNDKDLMINWPTETPILSDKDRKNLTLKEFINRHKGIVL